MGATGHFAMTARSACGRKRKNGGEAYRLVYLPVDADAATVMVEPTMVDTNDGNYHFSLTPAVATCGEYTASLTLDDKPALTWATTISAMASVASESFVMTAIETAVVGVPTSVEVQLMDANGCKSDYPDTDLLRMEVRLSLNV